MSAELTAIEESAQAYRKWRHEKETEYPERAQPNLAGAKLRNRDLGGLDFSLANLSGADLSYAKLHNSHFYYSNLSGANLYLADLRGCTFENCNLSRCDLQWADFRNTDLFKVDFQYAILVDAKFDDARIVNCGLYGSAIWNISTTNAVQDSNSITPWDDAMVDADDSGNVQVAFEHSDANIESLTVDDIEVAQFIYLMVKNEKIRNILDTITTKVVLILGRFTLERKLVLDALRESLKQRGYISVIFDFEKPASRNLTETVSTLAHLARFIIADVTDAKSIPQELQRVIPNLPSVPIQIIIEKGQTPYAMLKDFFDYPWVLEIVNYSDVSDAVKILEEKIILPAELKAMSIAMSRKI